MKLIIRTFFSILILLYGTNCANQSQPTGGPKDETAPKLLSTVPQNGQVNYKGKVVALTFDEDIITANAKQQLVITPLIDQEYTIKYKKRTAQVILSEPLKENTTYTFNFREAIKDITEGNVPENLKIAFSTGSYLDSLHISGNITSLFTTAPEKEVTIALYKAKDTLDVFNSPPLYLTTSAEDGSYLIENIKNDDYLLYAYGDSNKNLKLEVSSESYGFIADTLSLTKNIDSLNIALQNLDISTFKLQSARTNSHYYILKFNKYVMDYTLSTSGVDTLYSQLYNNNKAIRIYNTLPIRDSLAMYITASDSIQQTIQDTLYLQFEKSERKKEAFKSNVSNGQLRESGTQTTAKATITFSKPIIAFREDSIYIEVDSLRSIFLAKDKGFSWNENYTELTLDTALEASLFAPVIDTVEIRPRPKLLFAATSFQSADGEPSIAMSSDLPFVNEENFSKIDNAIIDTEEEHYILQLIESKTEKVVREYIDPTVINAARLRPGSYRIRILVDSNGNGRWDPGNMYDRIMAEPILFYQNEEGQEEIVLRENWEISDIQIKF